MPNIRTFRHIKELPLLRYADMGRRIEAVKGPSLSQCQDPSPCQRFRSLVEQVSLNAFNEYEKAGNRAFQHSSEDKRE